MNKVLKQLYNGEIFPAESWRPSDEEFENLRKRQRTNNEKFITELNEISPELAKRFIIVLDDQLDMLPCEYEKTFVEAFRLGAKIMLEVMT